MCKHLDIEIEEMGTSITSHRREDGGTWSHVSEYGDYTGTIYVHCYDCGFEKKYISNYPKWLQRYLDEICTPNTACTPTPEEHRRG